MNEIKELGAGLRKYRTEIPNMILELGLTVYELALYVHLKRTAGDSGGSWKSTRTLVQETGMGAGSIVRAKKGLITYGLIEISQEAHKSGTDNITIVPVWEKNFQHFHEKDSVPRGNKAFQEGTERSQGETKNKPIKKEPKKKDIKEYTPFNILLETWKELFPNKPQPRKGNKTLRKRVNIRWKDKWFRENWKEAMMRASKSPHLNNESWFNLDFFVKNDENAEKCFNRVYSSFDKSYGGNNGKENKPSNSKPAKMHMSDQEAVRRLKAQGRL